MQKPLPFTELKIIGYANRLTETTRPTVVAPIFRLKSDAARHFLPPYIFQEGLVCGANERTEEELNQLDAAGEVTLFAQELDAQPGYELWVDINGEHHYEPVAEADAKLKKIAFDNIGEAVAALRDGNYDLAKNHCRIAISADDRLIEPHAIRAAIARRQNEPGIERLMAKLAEKRTTPQGFEMLVNGYLCQANASAPQAAHKAQSPHPMARMATIRPQLQHA